MWQLSKPSPVKLIIGILAADNYCLDAARKNLQSELGTLDLTSHVWPFDQTDYYQKETGSNTLRQFVSREQLIDPGRLAEIKLQTNKIEKELARTLELHLPRPVNLDPGTIEPSKLVLATTKNYSHRIYIGKKIYAEVTLRYDKKAWQPFDYTYPDYQQDNYHRFFTHVRNRLLEQLKS